MAKYILWTFAQDYSITLLSGWRAEQSNQLYSQSMLPYHMLYLAYRDDIESHHTTATNNIWYNEST